MVAQKTFLLLFSTFCRFSVTEAEIRVRDIWRDDP